MMTVEDILDRLAKDANFIEVLTVIRSLDVKDAWLAAGLIRNAIWNMNSDKALFDWSTDIDVVFHDKTMTDDRVLAIQEKLYRHYPHYHWEVTNQAVMHVYSPHTSPYTDTCDAVFKYPERCTALAIRLTSDGELEVFAPYGFDDVLTYLVRPTPHFKSYPERLNLYRQRIKAKNWSAKWPNLIFEDRD